MATIQADEPDNMNFTVQDVAVACKKKQKYGKVVDRANNIAVEAFIYGTRRLFLHVSVSLTRMHTSCHESSNTAAL